MGSIQQITTAYLNDIFNQKGYHFELLEFERGLGIVDDAFYLTLKSDDEFAIVKISTNLRCIKKGKVTLSYNDLFINTLGKKMSKKEYQSQREIEKSALQTSLKTINLFFHGKPVKMVDFSSYGDLKIKLLGGGLIIANDNLDYGKAKRQLYSILFLDKLEPFVITILECAKEIKIIKTTDFILFPEKDNCGFRFIANK